jgi:molecular chaperone DnaK
VQAGILTGELRDLMLNDVTPLSLGLETIGGVMKVLIPRNTPIPVRKSDVFSTSEANQSSVEVHVLQGERQMAEGNKSLGRFRLSGIPPAPRGVPQVQVSFDIDANGLLQVSAMDRTTGRQQSVSIQGGSNLSAEEIETLIEEAEQKAAEDRRKRAAIDRRNKAQTLVAQAERRLRDAALELGPYGAERQQRAVEMAVRDVQDLLALEQRGDADPGELDLAVGQLQESLFGLNRRLLSERRAEQGPLQGLRSTLGSLKDELFADDDDWDDWSRPGRDPWAPTPDRFAPPRAERDRWRDDRFGDERFSGGRFAEERPTPGRLGGSRLAEERWTDDRLTEERFADDRFADDRFAQDRSAADRFRGDRRAPDRFDDDRWSGSTGRDVRDVDDRFSSARFNPERPRRDPDPEGRWAPRAGGERSERDPWGEP